MRVNIHTFLQYLLIELSCVDATTEHHDATLMTRMRDGISEKHIFVIKIVASELCRWAMFDIS